MKRLVFILFVIVLIWLLVQLYASVTGENLSGGVIPYFGDVQNNESERHMLLIGSQ